MKKILAVIVAFAVLAFVGYTHRDQVMVRFSCADKVSRQYTTPHVVAGAYDCFTPATQFVLSKYYGVENAKDFALAIGSSKMSDTYLGITNDGGYTYRFDYPLYAHNPVKPMLSDIVHGKFSAAWDEVNGNTQGWTSAVVTYYLYPQGYSEYDMKGGTVDVSGKILAIQ